MQFKPENLTQRAQRNWEAAFRKTSHQTVRETSVDAVGFLASPLCALCVLCVRFLLHEWFSAVFAGIGAGVGALPGPRGASEGSRWEASTAGRGAPTGPPAGHGRAPAGRMNAPLAWQWFMRLAGAPGASPGGCAPPPELPTGYPHARLQREASKALISRKTGGTA